MNKEDVFIARVVNSEGKVDSGNGGIVAWWSFGKTALAAGALALVRDKRLELDASFDGKPYTLRQLLNHTAGAPDYGMLKEYREAVKKNEEPWDLSVLLEKVNADTLLFKPGEKFGYSNVGYALVRQKIEAVTGKGIEEALEELVFTPLDIPSVELATAPQDLDTVVGGNPNGYHPGWVYHGLFISPLPCAPLFLHRLLTTDFLPASLKHEMIQSVSVGVASLPGRPFQNPSYGLGLMEGTSKVGLCIGHTGQGPMSTIAIYHFPDMSPVETKAAYIPNGEPQQQGLLEKHLL